jgi:hypothetical protein
MSNRKFSTEEANSRMALAGTPYYVDAGAEVEHPSGTGWRQFVINEDAVIASITIESSAGASVTVNYTGVTLSAGIPFGAGSNNQGSYLITAIQLTSGSVILYD